MDGHPQATAVLFPCSLSQGFKEAVMRITLFDSVDSCSMVYNKRGSIAYTGLSQRRRCLVQPETEMTCMAGDGDVLYGRRRRCLVWPEMTVDSGMS